MPLQVQEEDATVAAPEQTDPSAAANLTLQVEALRRNAVWRV
jgi:hypothetical protein